MIDFDTAQRLIRMQERLRTATYHELRKEGGGKSSEGAISLSFCLPAVVSDERDPSWTIEVYSYILGPHRNHTFHGKTAAEAISKPEDAVSEWCFGTEMEMFEAAYTSPGEDGEN